MVIPQSFTLGDRRVNKWLISTADAAMEPRDASKSPTRSKMRGACDPIQYPKANIRTISPRATEGRQMVLWKRFSSEPARSWSIVETVVIVTFASMNGCLLGPKRT
jgi:hypothetical protein